MAAAAVTVCPPMPAHSLLAPDPQFFRLAQPVGVKFAARGETRSNGLGFDDLHLMQTSSRSNWKRYPTPAFMYSSDKLQEVITRACEQRAGFMSPQPGSRQERLDRAQARLLSTRDKKIEQLDRACLKYLEAKTAGLPTKRLETIISNLDSQLLALDRPAAFIASILFLSYRMCLDSVGVSQHLRGIVKPCTVRQTLFRCRQLADRMDGKMPPKHRGRP